MYTTDKNLFKLLRFTKPHVNFNKIRNINAHQLKPTTNGCAWYSKCDHQSNRPNQ